VQNAIHSGVPERRWSSIGMIDAPNAKRQADVAEGGGKWARQSFSRNVSRGTIFRLFDANLLPDPGCLPFSYAAAKDGGVNDADDFRARATEIFRQLRTRETGARPYDVEEDELDEHTPDRDAGAEERGPLRTDSSGSRDPTNGWQLEDPPSGQWRSSVIAPPPESVQRETLPEPPPRAGTPAPTAHDAGSGPAPTNPPTNTPLPSAPTPAPSSAVPAPPDEALASSSTLRLDPLADITLAADDPVDRPPGSRHPGADRPLPRILAIANQKGGVGKTTTAVNLGAALAELQYRVLVVDLDPQGNATTGLGINGRNLDASVYDVILHETPIEDVIEPTSLRNLFVAPATIDLAGAEIELVPVFSRELRLRRALSSVRDDFDFVLIDCPPSLGLLTVNGLAAATEVVVPIQCEYYALEGLSQLLRNVNLVQGNLNNTLELSTIILTMYDARTRLAEQVVDEVRSHFGARVCRNVVPRTVRLSEAPSFGQPIIVFDSSSRGAIAYRELAKEVSGGAPKRTR
jgi:chromosome partitioning protein